MAKRILVIEDDPYMLFAIRVGLERSGYEVTTASNGPSALQLFRESPLHLIILDIMMPGMDGWEVFRQIRQTSTVPIIMLTAYLHSEEDIHKGLEMGATAYLVKPVPLEELLSCIQVALNQSK